MKLSRTALKVLTAKYRAILLRSFIVALGLTIFPNSVNAKTEKLEVNKTYGDYTIEEGDVITVPFMEDDSYREGNYPPKMDKLTMTGGLLKGEFEEDDWEDKVLEVTGDTFISGKSNIKNVELNAPYGKVEISGTDGNFENFKIDGSTEVTINGGTFQKETSFEGHNITVNGGTFVTDRYSQLKIETYAAGDVININGGDFTKAYTELFAADGTIKINSDKVSKITNGIDSSNIKAKNLELSGAGLVTNKLIISSENIKGHYVLNEDTNVGASGQIIDKWSIDGKDIYRLEPELTGIMAGSNSDYDDSMIPVSASKFENAQLILNNNAEIGSSIIQWNANDPNATNITYSKAITKLTDEQINTSANKILSSVVSLNSENDMPDYIGDAIEVYVPMSEVKGLGDDDNVVSFNHDGQDNIFDLEDYIEDAIENGTNNTEAFKKVVDKALRVAYNNYNKYISGETIGNTNGYKSEITLDGSNLTLNDNARIVNHSKVDYVATVNNSSITVNGNNKVVALDRSGDVYKETVGTLNMTGDNSLNINGSLESNLNIASGTTEINNLDGLKGNVKNEADLKLTSASDSKIAEITGAGKLYLDDDTNISLKTLKSTSQSEVHMDNGASLDLSKIGDSESIPTKLKIDNNYATVNTLIENGDKLNGNTSDINGKLRVSGLDFSKENSETDYVLTTSLNDHIVLGTGIKVGDNGLVTYNAGTVHYKPGATVGEFAATDGSAVFKIAGTQSLESPVTFDKGDKVLKSEGATVVGTMNLTNGASLTVADTNVNGTLEAKDESKLRIEASEGTNSTIDADITLENKSEAEIVASGSMNIKKDIKLVDSTISFHGNGIIEGKILADTIDSKVNFINGTFEAKNTFDPFTGNIADANVIRSGIDEKINWIVNSGGILTHTVEANISDHGNSIELAGGTLNLANNIVSEVKLTKFTVSADSLLSIDADLAAGKADLITADSYDGTGVITVSNLNLINTNKQDTSFEYKIDDFSITYGGNAQVGDYKVYYQDGKFFFAYNPQSKRLPLEDKVVEEAQKAQAASVTAAVATVSSVQNALNNRINSGFNSKFKQKKSSNNRNRNNYFTYSGRSSGDNDQQYGLWAQGLYNYTDRETTTNAPGFTAKTKGVVAGFDAKLTDTVSAGIAYSYAKSDISGGTDVDTHTFMLYGQYKPNNFFMNVNAGYGMSKTELKDKTDYDSDIISANTMVGYEMGDITPYAEGRYMHIKSDSYKRNGEKFEGKSANVLTGVAGLRYSHEFGNVRPSVGAAATYDFVANNNKLVLKNAGATVETERTKRLGGEVKAGLEAQLTNSWSISADYTGNFKEHYQSHTGTVSATFKF